MKNRIPYSVPEGYFDTLEDNLRRIPSSMPVRSSFRWPYYALSMACAAALALFVMMTWGRQDKMDDGFYYNELLISDLIPHTDPYLVYSIESEDTHTMTAQDIEDYLITCAVDINE